MRKPCLTCGTPTRNGSYCPQHGKRDWKTRRRIETGWAWGKLRAEVHARDRVCVTCGSTDQLEVHHRVPLTDGGPNNLANLELRCHNCHTEAHSVF